MDNLLQRFSTGSLDSKLPFPGLTAADALPADIFEKLLTEFPSNDLFPSYDPNKENYRLNLKPEHILIGDKFSSTWKEFIAAHVGPAFWSAFLNVFGSSLPKTYPGFEEHLGRARDMKVGIAGIDTLETHDVLLSALIGINTPIHTFVSRERGVHVDAPNKLFYGLLYFRDPEDDSQGGDLHVYKFKRKPVFIGHTTRDTYVKPIVTVPYRSNMFMFGLNTPQSLHGVTTRYATPYTRKFIYFSATVRKPLFDLSANQETPFEKYVRRFSDYFKPERVAFSKAGAYKA